MIMSEPILLGFGIIVLMLGWHFIIRKTTLDTQRDKLFDLRESVRKHYLETGIGLEDKTYKELRRLINSQIRFLEDASFSKMIVWRVEYQDNKELKESIDHYLDERFRTDNEALTEYIKKIRSLAYHHTMEYMLYSSLGMTTVCYAIFPIALLVLLAHASVRLSGNIFGEAVLAPLQRLIRRDLIEGLSAIKQKPNAVHA